MERTDASGRWLSDDGGVSWSLVEPSEAWLADRAATTDPEPVDVATAIAAATDFDELKSMLTGAA